MFRKVIISCLFAGVALCLNEAELFGKCDEVDFACRNPKQAKACGAIQTCISQVWSKEYTLSVMLDAVEGKDETTLDNEDTDWIFETEATDIVKAEDESARCQEIRSLFSLNLDCQTCIDDLTRYTRDLVTMVKDFITTACTLFGPLKDECVQLYEKFIKEMLDGIIALFPAKNICKMLHICPSVKDEKENCSDCISSFMNSYKVSDDEIPIPLYPLRIVARINCERLGKCAEHAGLQYDAK